MSLEPCALGAAPHTRAESAMPCPAASAAVAPDRQTEAPWHASGPSRCSRTTASIVQVWSEAVL